MKPYVHSAIVILFLGSLLHVNAQLNIDSTKNKTAVILEHLKNPSKDYILVISHRGDWRYAPENSLEAVKRCIALGVDVVEIDVRLTKDGHLIVMHDKTVDRTTNGSGAVKDMNLADIKKLRLKNGYGAPGSRQQVPTLEEVMTLTKGKIMVNLDKVEGKTVQEAYEVLKKTKTVNQAIFKGRETVQFMRNKYGSLMDSIIYMPIIVNNLQNPSKFILDYYDKLAPIAYEMLFNSENSKNFKEIKKLNKKGITVLTIALWDELCAGHTDEKMLIENPEVAWGWLIENGANAIMTDRPGELIDYLKQKGLRKRK